MVVKIMKMWWSIHVVETELGGAILDPKNEWNDLFFHERILLKSFLYLTIIGFGFHLKCFKLLSRSLDTRLQCLEPQFSYSSPFGHEKYFFFKFHIAKFPKT